MNLYYLCIVPVYVLISLLMWHNSDEESFDLFYPLTRKCPVWVRILSGIVFLLSAAVLLYVVVSFVNSSVGLIFIGVVLFGYALYGLKKNNTIGKMVEVLTTTKDRVELAAEKSILPAIAGAGCLLIISLGILFYLSDRFDATSDDSKKAETVQSLQSLGKISTLQFDIKKIIEPDKLFGEDLLYTMRCSIETGVDMSSISSNSVSIRKNSIKLVLPPPEIINTNIFIESGSVDYKNDKHSREFTAKERQVANATFQDMVAEDRFVAGLCEQTEQPTLSFFRNLLRKLGYENIEITFDK